MKYLFERYKKQAIIIQKVYRSYKLRKRFFISNKFRDLWWLRAQRNLVHYMSRLWRHYKLNKLFILMNVAAEKSMIKFDWNYVIKQSNEPIRIIGIYEVYNYPNTSSVYYYRNTFNNECSWIKPKGLSILDDINRRETDEKRLYGGSKRQIAIVTKWQALWRGYHCRSYYNYVEISLKISLNAELNYFNNPMKIDHLLNYALYCHVVLQDYNRARMLYIETLNRMEYLGPDSAIILYSYCIFSFVTHNCDYNDILMLLTRAKLAEEIQVNQLRKVKGLLNSLAIKNKTYHYGTIYNYATIGFYKNTAEIQNTSESWHNYAIVEFLIYNNYQLSFQLFVNAFKINQNNKLLKLNFDLMIYNYHGTNNVNISEIIRYEMEKLAIKDNEDQLVLQNRRNFAIVKVHAANKIKVSYVMFNRSFIYSFIHSFIHSFYFIFN